MDHHTDRPEALATREIPYPTIEEELEKHPGCKVLRNFADDGTENGAVRPEIQKTLLSYWKNGKWAIGTKCSTPEGVRYVIFAEVDEPGIDNIIGGIALRQPLPPRY